MELLIAGAAVFLAIYILHRLQWLNWDIRRLRGELRELRTAVERMEKRNK